MQEEVVKRLRNLYLEYGDNLFVDNMRLNAFLEDILFDYPVEKKRLNIVIKENIVNSLIYERENSLLPKAYMYINLMQDVYGMSEEMAYELINAIYFAIYGFDLQKNEIEVKKSETVYAEAVDSILRDLEIKFDLLKLKKNFFDILRAAQDGNPHRSI